MKKHGFTLMEVLAVLLLLAVIVSLAVPALRNTQYEIKNGRARAAARRLAEGLRSFRLANRGAAVSFPEGGFSPTTSQVGDELLIYTKTCGATPASTGIPASASEPIELKALFGCGYLSPKDFEGIPYTFMPCPLPAGCPAAPDGCQFVAYGNATAGSKYAGCYTGYIYVDENNLVQDNYPN